MSENGDLVRLKFGKYTSPGRTAPRCGSIAGPAELTYRFPLIVESLARLRWRSCIIDGEAVACDDDGMPSFERIRYRRHDTSVFLYAFDLIELNGDDLRRDPLEVRKATLATVLARVAVEFNKNTCRWTILGDAATVHHSADREQLLDVFLDANEPLTPKSVTEQLESVTARPGVSQSHFSHSAVRKILSRMADPPTGSESHSKRFQERMIQPVEV
jgi:hypothetical protein